jgi:coenzyme Q-binding protein COQ10
VLSYTPDQLFEMVGDVALYPDFVQWITAMRVWNLREDEPGVTSLDAEAQVRFAVLKERFSTHVRRDAGKREITVQLLRGPFRRLLNRWRFVPHERGTEVQFDIDFEFKSKLLQTLLAANFEHAVSRLIDCFEVRAKALYGPGER